jgi:hypothetical protein
MTYADGKNRRRSLSMPTAYLRRRLFSLSRRLPTPTVGVAYSDGILGLCRRLLAVVVEISCYSACLLFLLPLAFFLVAVHSHVDFYPYAVPGH